VTMVCTAVRYVHRVTVPRECARVSPTVSPSAGTCCTGARQSRQSSTRTLCSVPIKACVRTKLPVVNSSPAAMDVARIHRCVAVHCY